MARHKAAETDQRAEAKMKLIYLAIIALGAFVAIWVFFVVPAERRHHERKLEMVRKQIEKREARLNEQAVRGENPGEKP